MIDGLRTDVEWSDLDVDVIDHRETRLLRLYRHPGGEWDPPPPAYRNLRVDPPGPDKSIYAVLYIGTRIDTVAQECRLLSVNDADEWTLDASREAQYSIARYEFNRAGIFVPIDGKNGKRFGLENIASYGAYLPYQQLGAELHRRFSHLAHGLSWRSFHRHQSGPVYALWHERKADLGLHVISTERLAIDPSWIKAKSSIPGLTVLEP
jgi:hypothetical protein